MEEESTSFMGWCINNGILMFNIKIYIPTIVLFFLFIGCSEKDKPSYKKLNEKYYQHKMCTKLDGEIEVVLKDRTRIDCLTDDYAIEVDWAKKWAEGIGQSLYYAYMTNKKPAVALIVGDNDKKYLKRLKVVSEKLDIKIIIINKE